MIDITSEGLPEREVPFKKTPDIGQNLGTEIEPEISADTPVLFIPPEDDLFDLDFTGGSQAVDQSAPISVPEDTTIVMPTNISDERAKKAATYVDGLEKIKDKLV